LQVSAKPTDRTIGPQSVGQHTLLERLQRLHVDIAKLHPAIVAL
jgi:hypothetical protein